MSDSMTSRERLVRAMRGQGVDRIPISPRDSMYIRWRHGTWNLKLILELQKQYGNDITYICGSGLINPFEGYGTDTSYNPDIKAEVKITDEGETKLVHRTFFTPSGKLEDLIRVAPAGGSYGIAPNPVKVEFLIKDRSDLDKIRHIIPDPYKNIKLDNFRKIDQELGEHGITQVVIRSPLDHFAGDARGVENLMVDYYEDPELFADILALFEERMTAETKACLEGGVQHIFGSWYYTSLSAGWSPKIFREVFVPMMKRHVELVHSYGATYDLYDDGKMMRMMPDYLSTGADVIETLTPPPVGDLDLKQAKEIVGDKMTLKGYTDLIYVMQKGTPKDVRDTVIYALQTASKGGRFILGSSDSFRENTSDENIKAYYDTAHEYGAKYL